MILHRQDARVHVCSVIPGQPYMAFFYSYCMLPMPLKDFFTFEEFKLIKYLAFYCSTCLQVKSIRDRLTGYENWVLYCHCKNPGSLQCRSAAMWVTPKIVKYMESFTWAPCLANYSLLANVEASRMCHVICSAFYQNYHLIILSLINACKLNIEGLDIRVFRYCKEYDTTFALFKCKRCYDRSESALYSCAQRIATLINLAHSGIRINFYDKRRFHKKYKARLDAIFTMVFDHRFVYYGALQ